MKLNILIMPDKFKGTLTARQAAQAIAAGWHRVRPGDHLELLPMCDGGDGFGPVMARLLGATRRTAITVDACHDRCLAPWWHDEKSRTAIIESAQIIGLSMLRPGKHHPFARNHPFRRDTRGLGVVLAKLAGKKITRCLIGLGGSATTDGGFGLARALGWEFLDRHRHPIENWTDLGSLAFLNRPKTPIRFKEIIIASDVQNPLLGPQGASRIYGPQKGLSPAEIPVAERALRRLARVVKDTLGEDFASRPGAGAAGGLGFAVMAFLGARIQSGFELFAGYSHLKQRLKSADLVLTGEGKIDDSTFMGKGVGNLARLCRSEGIRCVGFSGSAAGDDAADAHRLFSQVYSLTELTSLAEAQSKPAYWLAKLAGQSMIDISR